MRFWKISEFDVANGPGVRVAIFVSGCSGMPCTDYCFNKDIQSFRAGSEWGPSQVEAVLDALDHEWVSGATFLGGEPFLNFRGLGALADSIHERFGNEKSIWTFSGFTLEQILPVKSRLGLLKKCDVLIDGSFVPALKDSRLQFRGSANQRILDIRRSLETSSPVWAHGYAGQRELSGQIMREYSAHKAAERLSDAPGTPVGERPR